MSSDYYGGIAGEIADEGSLDDGRDEPCEGCTCCTRLGCYRGEDSECPYSENTLTYLCPCTED